MALTITFPDGSERNYDSGVTGAEIAASIGPRLAKAAVAVKLDGAAIDLGRPITENGTLEVVTDASCHEAFCRSRYGPGGA